MSKSCGWTYAKFSGYSWWCSQLKGHEGPCADWRVWNPMRFPCIRKFFMV